MTHPVGKLLEILDSRSPHEYPNGITPNIAAIDESEESQGPRKVGVLLMDHGSKNEASNSRLKHLAELYQLSTDADKESIANASKALREALDEDDDSTIESRMQELQEKSSQIFSSVYQNASAAGPQAGAQAGQDDDDDGDVIDAEFEEN